MTIPKALPPQTDHFAATRAKAAQVQGAADAAIEYQTAKRPDAPKRILKSEIQSKIIHHTRGK